MPTPDSTVVTSRVPRRLKNRIEQAARAEGRTVSTWIRRLARENVNRQGENGGEAGDDGR